MAEYLYLWPNGEGQISGWFEIDFQTQQAYKVTKDGERAEQVALPEQFSATTDDFQNYQYHHKGKKRSKPSATSHEEYIDGQWQTINTNVFDGSAPSLFSILNNTSIVELTRRILVYLDIEPEKITKDIKTLDDLILFANISGEIKDSGLDVIKVKVKDLIKNPEDLVYVLGKILNPSMQDEIQSQYTQLSTPENVNSIDDFVRVISQLSEKNQKEFYLKVREKVLPLLRNSKSFADDMVKVISAVTEASILEEIFLKDNEISKRIRFSNDYLEIKILERLDEKHLAKTYPFLQCRQGSPSSILYPVLKLSNSRFEYFLNNFPDVLTTKRNEEDLIVESKHWQQYTISDFNGLINDAQKYPDKYNILIKSAAFKRYIQRLYDVWCQQDDGFIAFFELKNLPAECKSWVKIKPHLTHENLTFATIKRLMKTLDDDNSFDLFTKIHEKNIPLTFADFSALASDKDNTECSVDTMAVVLHQRFKDWCSGSMDASNFDRVVNLKAISIRSFARIFPVLNNKIIEWFNSAAYVFHLIADLPYEKAKYIVDTYKTNIIVAIQKDNEGKYWALLQSSAINALFDGLSDSFDGLVNSAGLYASIHDSLNEENQRKFSERWQSKFVTIVTSSRDGDTILKTLSPVEQAAFRKQLQNNSSTSTFAAAYSADVTSITDVVHTFSRLNNNGQKDFFNKVKEKILSLLRSSEIFADDMVKVISAVTEASILEEIFLKDNEISKRIRFSNDYLEIKILERLDEKHLAKTYPFLQCRQGSPSSILYPLLKLSNSRFEYFLNNFPDVLTTKRNEEDLIVESEFWQQYAVPDFNGLISDAQKYPDKYNILIKSAAFKNYIQRLYDVWCKQDDGFIAFFELKNLPVECKSWVKIKPHLTRENLTFANIKSLMKCLDDDNCFDLFTKVSEENIPLTFADFSALASDKDNTECSVDTMAVVLHQRFKDWCSGSTGASDFDKVVNLKSISTRSFARIFPVLNNKIIEWFNSAEYVFKLIADLPYEKAKYIVDTYKTNIIVAIQKDNQKKHWEMLQSPAMNTLFDEFSNSFDGLVNSAGVYASIHDSLNEENRRKFSERWQSKLVSLVHSLVDIENIIETLSPDAKEKFKTQLENETLIERLQPESLHDYAIIAMYLPESVAKTIYLGRVHEVFYAKKPCDKSDLSAVFGFLFRTGMLLQAGFENHAIQLDQSMLDVLLESINANIQAIKDKKKITNLFEFCKTIFNNLGKTALDKILSNIFVTSNFLSVENIEELKQLGKPNNTNKPGSSTGYGASGSAGSNVGTNTNFATALENYEAAKLYITKAAYPSNMNISSEQRMALVEKHAAEIFKETGISQYNQTPYSLEKFSEKVSEIFNVDLRTVESFNQFKGSQSSLLKDCVMLFGLRAKVVKEKIRFERIIEADLLHMIEFDLFAKDVYKNSMNVFSLLGVDKATSSEEKLKKGYRRSALQFHPDKTDALGGNEKVYCVELYKFCGTTLNILSDPQKKIAYENASLILSEKLNDLKGDAPQPKGKYS